MKDLFLITMMILFSAQAAQASQSPLFCVPSAKTLKEAPRTNEVYSFQVRKQGARLTGHLQRRFPYESSDKNIQLMSNTVKITVNLIDNRCELKFNMIKEKRNCDGQCNYEEMVVTLRPHEKDTEGNYPADFFFKNPKQETFFGWVPDWQPKVSPFSRGISCTLEEDDYLENLCAEKIKKLPEQYQKRKRVKSGGVQ